MAKNKMIIETELGPNTAMTLNIAGFMKDLDKAIKATFEAEDLVVNEKTGSVDFSLTDCANVCDVDGPQLNYYFKQGIVKPWNNPEKGKKKYFTYEGLLTFWIICQLRSIRINVEVLKSIQKKLAKLKPHG